MERENAIRALRDAIYWLEELFQMTANGELIPVINTMEKAIKDVEKLGGKQCKNS